MPSKKKKNRNKKTNQASGEAAAAFIIPPRSNDEILGEVNRYSSAKRETILELEHALKYEMKSEKHQSILKAVKEANSDDILPSTYETPGMLEFGNGISRLLKGPKAPMFLSKMHIDACEVNILRDEGMGEADGTGTFKGGDCWLAQIGDSMNLWIGKCRLTSNCLWDLAVQYRGGRSNFDWPGYWATLQCPFCANLATPCPDKVFFMVSQTVYQTCLVRCTTASRYIPRLCCQDCFCSNLNLEGGASEEEVLNYSIWPVQGGNIPTAYDLNMFFEMSGMSAAFAKRTTSTMASGFNTEDHRSRISKSATKANRGQPTVKIQRTTRQPCQNCGLFSQGCRPCSACNEQAYYCGADCQKAHWKIHKKICKSGGTTTHPEPSVVVPTERPSDKDKSHLCPQCESNSIQEGQPIMCFACGVFVVCGSCATTPQYGGRNARPAVIAYLCGGCADKKKKKEAAVDKPGVLLLRLLDKKPTGEHVKYARLILAQMRLHDMEPFTGLKQDIEGAKQEYLWLANNLDYAPAQLALASFRDEQCIGGGEVYDGPVPLQLLEYNDGLEESPFPPNKQIAMKYYRRAAWQKWSLGLTTLGTMYKRGEVFEQNMSAARIYLEEAADLGDALAAHNVSRMYVTGYGVEEDFITGIGYLSQAAEHGLFQAMFMFGQLGRQNPGPLREDGRKWMEKLVEAEWEPPIEQMAMVYEDLRRFYRV